MTKSTITRERLEEIVSDPMINQGSEFAMMARMALAAMDSEPVAYTGERNLGYIDRGRETAYLWGKQNSESSDVALYRHAQPAPAVPGKWIPVSEQMPEDRTQVILWDAEIGEVTSGHYSHKTHTFYHCGDAIENEITHWMPMPAAPQEVKGE
ncbi:DUF551 domain-containing protein [Klebsiella pneumoniae]|jgi:hypothetical protein|uniref:DUF551 domain-containing protein n=1 Tax=Klebsiella pneumoniae TaxID=573 RepID=UPI000B6F5EBB|nr:DUF551 domain-containing protein [Klebsiella pneumoniae]OVI16701.1 hypothetical protein B8019_19030 [Klebsiella pneumoniae]